MGYTHYVRHRDPFTDEEWSRFQEAFARLVEAGIARGIPLSIDNGTTPLSSHQRASRAWEVSWDDRPTLQINGVGGDAHETFVIYRDGPPRQPWSSSDFDGFDFCKTRQKPYDIVVTAILCWAETVYPGRLNATSDGDAANWTRGLDLARETFPGLEIDLPPGVMGIDQASDFPS